MGYLRLLLSLVVSIHHLYLHSAPAGWAVFGFYTLSAYLITLVIDDIYKHLPRGRIRFLANRALRLYPTYWYCLIIAIACILATDGRMEFIHYSMQIPNMPGQWLRQVSMLGLLSTSDGPYQIRLLPSAWSLNVEVVYYLIIGLVAGYKKWLAQIWLAASLLLTGWALFNQDQGFYFTFWGPSICFSIGCVACHYRKQLLQYCPQTYGLFLRSAVPLFAASGIAAAYYAGIFLYTSPLVFSFIILSLHNIAMRHQRSHLEQLCADLAYPVFLLHWPIAAFVEINVFGLHALHPTLALWLLTFATSIAMGLLVIFCIEQPLKYWRGRIRAAAEDFTLT